ncbi:MULTISPECIES: aminotransferase [unclassified Rhizobium]|uniref:aminotransferase n=1 Tax=unclassified Rhizobium TaxID=2613769 RepID=UPI0016193668|nr:MULTISPECIES: aminotransferase [unclassified Rhizobium]MBB3386228.1 4-aminobutyrate--pyruvate transaminase [Rhizobium sp. BK098]MBB3571915.1 4-aminobutyrate--pyruvate transaminase [Rhizobium sp. BK491]MBB3617932.1 4-aminobutyrate--pyruvate transaminase [Rhizobium sp. BK609]MBB3683615.1 4-aminobutyrate--pyruvate transaminase [Rhizobium sp. BK612]
MRNIPESAVIHPFTNLEALKTKPPLVMKTGKGVFVANDDGAVYLEAMAGLWCVSLGFSEPRLADAAYRQMSELPFYHIFMSSSHAPADRLARELIDRAPSNLTRVFFSTSGSEANETAIKLVWKYNNLRGKPNRKKIISRKDGYHGSTTMAASLCGLPNMHDGFDLPAAISRHTDSPHYWRYAAAGETEQEFSKRLAHSLEALILSEGPETIGAFIAEPIMGAGGVIVPPEGYFEAIVPVLKKHGILLIADEIICGFGRTGEYWGSDLYGLRPDILTCGKQISSGYQPISATLLTEELYDALAEETGRAGGLSHGFTHSGHPVCAAVALEAIKIYDERKIVEHVKDIGHYLQDRLRETFLGKPFVGEVRGIGLLAAVQLSPDRTPLTTFAQSAGAILSSRALEEKIIVRGVKDSIVMSPPLIIDRDQIDTLVKGLAAAHEATVRVLEGNVTN